MKIQLWGIKASARWRILKEWDNLTEEQVQHLKQMFEVARRKVRDNFCNSRHLFGWGLKEKGFWFWAAAHSVNLKVFSDECDVCLEDNYYTAPYLEKIQKRVVKEI